MKSKIHDTSFCELAKQYKKNKIERMSKNILFLAFVMISQMNFGQITKSLGDFNKVTSFDQIEVLLIQGAENKIILNGNGAEEVELINKNGELKIRMPLTKLLSGDNVSATVYFKNIDAIEANEGSRISSEETFKAISFDIIAKEGSQIKINLNVDRLTVKSSNGSNVNLEGKAKNQDAIINSGGELDAENLITIQTIITANAGGEANVFATDLVDAKTRAGGNIKIYGKPKQINKKTVLGGTIKESNE
jgi:Putative auto-transporter adhesin, head GIN domain